MDSIQISPEIDSNQGSVFHRLELLTGTESLHKLRKTPVIIFGVGGVGSWVAEALIRSGIEKLTMVDSDLVCVTNINRQVQATHATVGEAKVHALSQRLLSINPNASIEPLQLVYDKITATSFDLREYEYVIDAIDSLSSKVELIINASKAGAVVYSALGASCKLDPTRIRVGSLWDSQGCRLGRFVRKRLRKRGFRDEVTCVYSDELAVRAQSVQSGCGTGACACPKVSDCGEDGDAHEWCSSKKQINGSVVHITAIFGFTLAGLVVQNIIKVK